MPLFGHLLKSFRSHSNYKSGLQIQYEAALDHRAETFGAGFCTGFSLYKSDQFELADIECKVIEHLLENEK